MAVPETETSKSIELVMPRPLAVLSESSKGWTKELNLIKWNDRDPKYDIREWSPDGSKMGKGITLSDEEVAVLKKALESRN